MNTPDAGRIRVRWYAVPDPPPGVYTLGDYGSSDWDDDPKSYDPVNGEESSTRDPWNDWRDCCSPPWHDAAFNDCPISAGPLYGVYRVPSVTIASDVFSLLVIPPTLLDYLGPCDRRSLLAPVGPYNYQWTLSAASLLRFKLSLRIFLGLAEVYGADFLTLGPADPSGPMVIPFENSFIHTYLGPPSIRVTGVASRHILADTCIFIVTEGGGALITES